jgi:hypothetical protein
MAVKASLLLLTTLMVSVAMAQGLPGGVSSAPISDNEAKEVAHFAAQELARKPEFASASNSLLQVAQILDVKTQVVAGLNFYITMNVQSREGVKTVDVVVWRKLSTGANGPELKLTGYKVHDGKQAN